MNDLAAKRDLFDLPEGLVYLDGNSLGPLPAAAREAARRVLDEEWGTLLIRGWNEAGWMQMPARVGDRVARLIGAAPGTVMMGDTLTIKVHQALAAALAANPDRRVVLSDSGNFPTDLYIAQGLLASLGQGHTLKIVAPEEVEGAIDETVAVVMLTEVDYRTGRLHDMADITRRAHGVGALTVWDLAHSAGALPVDLTGSDADFAVGCSYKYLNGGPDSPAFVYVAPRHIDGLKPILSGWMGHEAPFAFDLDYRAGAGIERMRIGTPPIVALSVLDAALDAFENVSMQEIRSASIRLSELFIAEVEAACDGLALASPRDPAKRGSQVSFRHPEGYAAMQAVIAHGVVGDFRAPDIMRFGFTPLYVGEDDVRSAAAIIAKVVNEGLWDRPEYRRKSAVT